MPAGTMIYSAKIVFLGEVARELISLWLLLFVTPLLLPLRGVLAGRDKALIWGPMAAMSCVVVFPVLLIMWLMQRDFIGGISAGALKG